MDCNCTSAFALLPSLPDYAKLHPISSASKDNSVLFLMKGLTDRRLFFKVAWHRFVGDGALKHRKNCKLIDQGMMIMFFRLIFVAVSLIAAPVLAAEQNTDRGGSDYRSFWLAQPDYQICEQTCAGEAQCKAWTYVKPNVQGPQAKCWLKKSVPAARTSDCCVSGVMDSQPSIPSEPQNVLIQNPCYQMLTGSGKSDIKWIWGIGSYAHEVNGLICLSLNKYVDTKAPFFTSYYCSEGIQNPASCVEDDTWRTSVIETRQTTDQSGTQYHFQGVSGEPWWATRWRLK